MIEHRQYRVEARWKLSMISCGRQWRADSADARAAVKFVRQLESFRDLTRNQEVVLTVIVEKTGEVVEPCLY